MILSAKMKEGQGMKYTILKRSKFEPDIWYAVAWTDVGEWADKIVRVLNICEDGEFKVLCAESCQQIELEVGPPVNSKGVQNE